MADSAPSLTLCQIESQSSSMTRMKARGSSSRGRIWSAFRAGTILTSIPTLTTTLTTPASFASHGTQTERVFGVLSYWSQRIQYVRVHIVSGTVSFPPPMIPPPLSPPSHKVSRDKAVRGPVVASVGFAACRGMGSRAWVCVTAIW